MLKKLEQTESWQIWRADSVFDLPDLAYKPLATARPENQLKADIITEDAGQNEWCQKSPQQLIRNLYCPDNSDIEKILSLKSRLTNQCNLSSYQTRRRRRIIGETGDELNPDRFLAARPDCFESIRHTLVERPLVRLAVNLSCSSDKDQIHLFWRGAAALALADTLTEQGISVQIDALMVHHQPFRDSNLNLCTILPLKAPENPLDLPALAAVVCDIYFMRGMLLPAEIRCAEYLFAPGSGSPDYIPGFIAKDYTYRLDKHILGQGDVFHWIKENLKERGKL